MGGGKLAAAHQLFCNHLHLVIEQDDMVTIPVQGAADVQQYLVIKEQEGRYLVRDILFSMEMAHINAEHLLVADGIVHVELMRSYHKGLTTQAEQLCLQGIDHFFFGILCGEYLIKGLLEDCTVAELVDCQVLGTIGNPSVQDTRALLFPPDPCCNSSATILMLYPELADSLVLAG